MIESAEERVFRVSGQDFIGVMAVDVKLPRGVTRDELEAAINRVLREEYARDLWAATCRAERKEVTTDDHQPTGQYVVDTFVVVSCVPSYSVNVDFGDFHWHLLEQPGSTYDKITVSRSELHVASWGRCCSRHEPGQPELRPRSLTRGHNASQTTAWFVERLLEALK